MELAFPVPDHLPRSQPKQPDVSTAILTALAEETPLTLASTSKWVHELETAIQETKVAIKDRILRDSAAFERQLETSKSVKRRLGTLSSHVDQLQADLEDPQTGVLPTILEALRQHSELAQRSCEADVTSSCLHHLNRCRSAHKQLTVLLEEGRLPEAVAVSAELQDLVKSCPPPIDLSAVMLDLQNIARSTKDRIQEQLHKALVDCISIHETQIIIKTQHSAHLSLHDIFVSIPPEVLVADLAALRKDIFARYISRILKGKAKVIANDSKLVIRDNETLDYISPLLTLFIFLHEQLLPYLPVPHRGDFAASFYIPLSDLIQSELLIPFIPSHVHELPPYLALVRAAIDLETQLVNMGFYIDIEHRIQTWGENVQSHYERKRRAELLDKARVIILTDLQPSVHIEVEALSSVVAKPDGIDESKEEGSDDTGNWGFDDEEKPQANGNNVKDTIEKSEEEGEDGWGFDDDLPKEEEPEVESDPWGDDWGVPPADDSEVPKLPEPTPAKGEKTPTSSKVKESYLVSHAAMAIATLAREILDEGITLMCSSVFQDLGFPTIHTALLLSATPSTFDLFLALYPISRTSELQQNLSQKTRYSNDCKYLAGVVQELQRVCESQQDPRLKEPGSLRAHFEQTVERLEVTGSSWLEDIIEEEIQTLLSDLDGAGRFIDLHYDGQFHEAQDKIKRIKNRITLLAPGFKTALTVTACYTSLGSIIDRILEQMLQEVLAIRDISEMQSERIAALFRIMHPLDTLFPELDNGVSTVASYVPLWLKFLYLSDILDGSLADILSWFEGGLLIDYEPQELVQLITALFAESPQRGDAIHRVLQG